MEDVLVHDAHERQSWLQQQLALMDGHELPLALGVIRDCEGPVYDREVDRQTAEIKKAKGYKNLRDMIMQTQETWEIE